MALSRMASRETGQPLHGEKTLCRLRRQAVHAGLQRTLALATFWPPWPRDPTRGTVVSAAVSPELTGVWNHRSRPGKNVPNTEYGVARIVAFTDNPQRRTSADLKSGPERDVGRGSTKVASFVIFFQVRRV